MTRRLLSNALADRQLTLSEVWIWYEFQRALIGEEKSRVYEAFPAGILLKSGRYLGKTWDELQHDFARQAYELGQMAMLGLLVATEAALRIDFVTRVANKRKDDVSRRYWMAYRRRGIERIRLDEDILQAWNAANSSAIRRAVSDFKGALALRHWLAHGRYWKPKLGRAGGYDASDIFDICCQLLTATGLVVAPAPAGPS